MLIGSMTNAGDVAPLQPLLDTTQRLCVEGRSDLAAVRQQVLDVFAVVGRADAQPGQRVAAAQPQLVNC